MDLVKNKLPVSCKISLLMCVGIRYKWHVVDLELKTIESQVPY